MHVVLLDPSNQNTQGKQNNEMLYLLRFGVHLFDNSRCLPSQEIVS
jgi:hypothetical protein